jgi:protoheme ferro-lyase
MRLQHQATFHLLQGRDFELLFSEHGCPSSLAHNHSGPYEAALNADKTCHEQFVPEEPYLA